MLALPETQEELAEETKSHYSSKYISDYRSFSKTGYPSRGMTGSTPDEQKKQENKVTPKPPWMRKCRSSRHKEEQDRSASSMG